MAFSSLAMAPAGAVLRVADYGRAKAFYADKVGLAVEDQPGAPGYGVVKAGAGTQFVLYESPLPTPENTVLGFTVTDIEAVVAELKGRGVVFEEYDMPGIKTVDGIAAMGPIKSAWFKDTEGNILAIGTM